VTKRHCQSSVTTDAQVPVMSIGAARRAGCWTIGGGGAPCACCAAMPAGSAAAAASANPAARPARAA
jgi:hypothetical protein